MELCKRKSATFKVEYPLQKKKLMSSPFTLACVAGVQNGKER